jgi:hypothetical protein
MKCQLKPLVINVAITLLVALASCKKESSLTTTSTETAIQAAVAQTQAVAVSPSTTTAGDSVYAINTCSPRGHRDTIAFSSLPSAAATYLSTNYSGYTAVKAFSVKDQSGTLTGYVAVIQFNGNPVAIKFDSAGAFVQVLELREGQDLLGHGFHEGGCFQNRDGRQRDTIALSALPAAITSYLTANYASDTLVRASKTRDSGYVVISKNNGLFATVFSASGTFVTRVQLPAHSGKAISVDQNALPANVLSYLSSTYPGYVFDKAFSITVNGVLQGYCVVIDANNTKYGIQFDGAGNFVRVKTIR